MEQTQDGTGTTDRAMTITEFLLARIAEDEGRARDFEQDHALAINGSYGNWDACYGASASWRSVERIGFLPARVLAECAAKRAIIESRTALDSQDLKGDPVRCGMYSALCDVIEDLAAVYADHLDYLQEWALG